MGDENSVTFLVGDDVPCPGCAVESAPSKAAGYMNGLLQGVLLANGHTAEAITGRLKALVMACCDAHRAVFEIERAEFAALHAIAALVVADARSGERAS
jgi:hypothetical protein